MPTTPIESAIGRRRKASTSMMPRPISDSVMKLGGHLVGARSARHEHLEDVHDAGEADHQGHEVHEGPDGDAQHVGRVGIAGDPVRLDPDLPGEEEHDRRADQVHDPDPGPRDAVGQDAVDEVHRHVLVGVRDERQAGEDQHHQPELGDLEGAADRLVQQVAAHHVEEGEHHHGKEKGGCRDAEHGVRPPFPQRLHLPEATFFSSWWNSSSTALALGSLPLAFLSQSSMIGPERFFASACIAAVAGMMFAPAAFSASRPTLSARSQDWPLLRAAYSPANLAMIAWSCFGILFHLSSFMKKPNAELYRPPGKTVAWPITLSSLNETIDSNGKKTPSATPEFSSSYDSGAGLTKAEPPRAFATCSAMPPPVRIFWPLKSSSDLIGFLVNIWPGPWVKTASRCTPLYS